MKIKEIYTKYKENENYIVELKLDKKYKALSFIYGYLIALVIMISPIIFTAHFFIYSNYFYLVAVTLLILSNVLLILGEIFYHKFLIYYAKDEKRKSLVINYILNGILYLFITTIFFIAGMILFF